MNLPSISFLLVVLLYPITFAAYLSFHKVGLREIRSGLFPFYGFENFWRLFEDDLYWISLKHTLIFTGFVVPVELVLSVGVAILINQSNIWSSRISRILVLVPYAIPPIASSMIWEFVYNEKFGYLNRFLFSLGIIDEYIGWSTNVNSAIFAVAIAYIWRTVPFSILLVHAALQGIPKDLYDAANVDGANTWRAFWDVTLPLLRPVIVVTLILRTTFAIMVFEEVMAITHGGPGDATWMAAWYTYITTFEAPFNIGMGSASAYVLAMISAFLAIFYVKFIYKRIDW